MKPSTEHRKLQWFSRISLGLAAALGACRSVNTPAPSVAPVATVALAPAPIAAVVPATAAAPAEAPCEGDACVREGIAALTAALPRVERSPEVARATLRASRSPMARAWSAYLAHHAGDEAAASAIMAELARDGESPRLAPDDVTAPGDRALYLARAHAEALSGSETDVVSMLPCAVFQWDGAAARRAFAPMHGSTRDAIIAPFKQRCAREAVERAMPAGARVLAASEAVSRALFREFPRPEAGTLWTAVAIDAHEALRDSLLGLTLAPEVGSDAAVRAVVARLAAERPQLLPHVGNYRRSAEGHVTAIANGICAVARMRGEAVTGGQCQRRAYTATLAAFTVWVGAQHGL